jgi:hypothetical protein
MLPKLSVKADIADRQGWAVLILAKRYGSAVFKVLRLY